MGANAQTSVPTFTAGEILTAANMNISARTGIPVFADTTARDAAFGGTGEKTLAEGQYAYIENIAGAAATQYYDGAAWQTLVSSGLNLITTTSFSAVSSFSLPANTFSSTYTNYLMYCNLDTSVASAEFDFRFRASGTDNTSNNYTWVRYGQSISGTANDTSGGSLISYFRLTPISGTYSSQFQIAFMAPQDNTLNSGYVSSGFYFDSLSNFRGGSASGVLSVTTSYDSATFFPSTGTVTGSYSVYGLAK
jgi:hypothetical protein